MAHNYLQLAGDVVEVLCRAENNQQLQFNKIQCQFLKQKLQETVTPLLSRVDVDSLPHEKQALFQQCCQGAALLELYRIVKDAEAIILGCCAQDWLKAAIKLANQFRTFVDIFFNLDWCTCVVGIVFSNALTNELPHVVDDIEGFGEAECADKMDEIRRALREPALRDRESLSTRLRMMQEDEGATDEQEIVAYLLQLVVADPTNMEPTTIDLLPNMKQSSVKRRRRLGSGGYAQVFEVELMGQKFAEKTFAALESTSFVLEANILAGLSHPHIVQVFGVSIDNRKCSIVMDLMHGDLLDAIQYKEQCFELPVALDIMLQVAEAMQYLHRKRITHRDLKSKNILLILHKFRKLQKQGTWRLKWQILVYQRL